MWSFESLANGEPANDDTDEEPHNDRCCIIHRAYGSRKRRRETDKDCHDRDPKGRKYIADVSESPQVKWSVGEDFGANLNSHNGLGDGVTNVQK